jgi:hypothetical protein
MKKAIKFDEADREAVIRAIEDRLGVRLSPVGRRRKWLRDGDGRSYWVLGGYGEWHGIPEEMIDAEAKNPTTGMLVIANRKREALQVFVGPVDPVVRNRHRLYRARKTTGDYQFTLTQKGARLHINQVPGFALTELSTFGYTADEKAKDQGIHAAKGLLRKLTKEQIAEFLRDLDKKE